MELEVEMVAVTALALGIKPCPLCEQPALLTPKPSPRPQERDYLKNRVLLEFILKFWASDNFNAPNDILDCSEEGLGISTIDL